MGIVSVESCQTLSVHGVKMDKMMLIPVARYNRLRQTVQKGDGDETVEEPLSDEVVMEAMPKNYKTKARALIGHIRNDGHLTWNDRGEIVYKGSKVTGSHITDLVKDAMRPYSNFTPVGKDVFYRALSDMNIPRGLINHQQAVLDMEGYKRRKTGPPGIRRKKSTVEPSWISL